MSYCPVIVLFIILKAHDDVIKWKHFPRSWPFVQGSHRWIPLQRPVTQSFDVFFDLRLNKRLSKQSWGWWFETPSRSLWRQCSDFDSVTCTFFLIKWPRSLVESALSSNAYSVFASYTQYYVIRGRYFMYWVYNKWLPVTLLSNNSRPGLLLLVPTFGPDGLITQLGPRHCKGPLP